MGIAGGGSQGFAAAIVYAISYALMAVAAFGTIVVMSSRGFEANLIDDYRGLNARSPWLAGLVLCVMASLAGLPPFLGFWAKLAVLRAAVDGGMLWLALVGVVFRGGGRVLLPARGQGHVLRSGGSGRAAVVSGRPLRIVFAVNALGLLALGIAWNPVMAWCQRAFA